MYNQTMVTNNPQAQYHSMYFGAPLSAPTSILSKSNIKLKEAIITTKMLMPMPSGLLLVMLMNDMCTPKADKIRVIT